MNHLSTEQQQLVEQLLALPKVFGSKVWAVSEGGYPDKMIVRIEEQDHTGFCLWLTVREICHTGQDFGIQCEIGPINSYPRQGKITIAVRSLAA